MFLEILLLGVALVAYIFYKTFQNNAKYFEDRNLKHTDALTELRALLGLVLGKSDYFQASQWRYSLFPDVP